MITRGIIYSPGSGGGGAAVSLTGPTETYQGHTETWEISDFSSFGTYIASVSHGSISITGSTVTAIIAGDAPETATITITRDGIATAFSLTVLPVSIHAPTVTIAGYPDSIPIAPVITTSAFAITGDTDTHASTSYQIKNTATGVVVWQALDSDQLTSIDTADTMSPFLDTATEYTLDVWHTGTTYGAGPVTAMDFTTADIYVEPPSLTIEGFPDSIPTGPLLSTGAIFVFGGSDTLASVTWRIKTTAGGTVWESPEDETNTTEIQVPDDTLGLNIEYDFECIHNGSVYGASAPTVKRGTVINIYTATPTISVTGEPDAVPESPVITTGAFSTVNGSDTHAETEYRAIRTSDSYEVWAASSITELLQKTIPAELLAEATEHRFEARHRGEAYGWGDWASTTATTMAEFPPVMVAGVVLTADGSGGNPGGVWQRIDEAGNAISAPDAAFWDQFFSGVEEYLVDGQHMVKIPQYYYKRGSAAVGLAEQAFWVSNSEKPGFTPFPAGEFEYGKYAASESGGKLQSIPGVMPKVSTSLTDFLTMATARNTGGVTGFRLHHYSMWLALQWLYLVRHASGDSQAVTGDGRVSQSSAANVDATDVAEAEFLGILGLWGNVHEWIDGARMNGDNQERRGYSGDWAATGEPLFNNGSAFYLQTFRMSGDQFLPATFETSNGDVTIPDYMRWRDGDRYPYVGGLWSDGAGAGLWCMLCLNAASSTYASGGSRLARVVA